MLPASESKVSLPRSREKRGLKGIEKGSNFLRQN